MTAARTRRTSAAPPVRSSLRVCASSASRVFRVLIHSFIPFIPFRQLAERVVKQNAPQRDEDTQNTHDTAAPLSQSQRGILLGPRLLRFLLVRLVVIMTTLAATDGGALFSSVEDEGGA